MQGRSTVTLPISPSVAQYNTSTPVPVAAVYGYGKFLKAPGEFLSQAPGYHVQSNGGGSLNKGHL